MIRKPASKTSLFLMEIIIVILFFSICSAICMQTFATAQMQSKRSNSLTGSVLACQSIAEIYKAENGNFEKLVSIIENDTSDETSCVNYNPDNSNILSIYYNSNWEKSSKSKDTPHYILVNKLNETEITIVAFDYEEEIFSLTVKCMRNTL